MVHISRNIRNVRRNARNVGEMLRINAQNFVEFRNAYTKCEIGNCWEIDDGN